MMGKMQTLHFDIIVVGAGPAGSMAARAAAEKDLDVVVLEEHPVAGTPVYCAEGLSIGGILDGGLEPDPEFVCQKITSARVYAPNRNYINLTSTDWSGYTLDRQVFDKMLCENAEKAGADIWTETTALNVIKNKGFIVGVEAKKGDEEITIKSDIVIGADGHNSIIRRSSGLQKYFSDWVSCAQFQLGELNLEDPSINEFYVGRNYAPGGYAWVFPKSKYVANVGLGVRKIHKKPAIEYLKDFIDMDERFKEAKILKKTGGICPVSGMLNKIVDNGLILCGDAAGLLIPMTGAGIHTGIVSGTMAGDVAAAAIKKGDVSSRRLHAYVNNFNEYWGKRISDSRKVIEMLDKFSDVDLNTLSEIVTTKEVIALANGTNVKGALAGIVRRSPRKIISLIRAYLS
jgi:digeranylgeranylglycerophospholipid reductase